jgi:HEAT repeat protein
MSDSRSGDSESADPVFRRTLDRLDSIRRTDRMAALRDLATIADRGTVHALLERVTRFGPDERVAAAETLASLDDPDWLERLRGDGLDLVRFAMSRHPLAVISLESVLADCGRSSSVQRSSAAEALGFVHDESVVEPLVRALEDPDGAVRAAVVAALKHNGDPQTVWAVVPVLLDGSSAARQSAAVLLGRLGNRAASGVLIRALGDCNGEVRRLASLALAELGDGQWSAIVRGDEGDIERLGRHPSFVALSPLVRALGNEDDIVRQQAVAALAGRNDPGVMTRMVAVIEHDSWRARIGAAEVLGTLGIGHPVALARLTDGLRHTDPTVRVRASEALGALRDRRALDALRQALSETDLRVRAAAVQAVRRIGSQGPMPGGAQPGVQEKDTM